MSGRVSPWDIALMSFLSHPPISFPYNIPQEQVYTVVGHRSQATRHRLSSPFILTSFPQLKNPDIRSLRNHYLTLRMTVHDFRRLHFVQDSCTFLITSYRMLLLWLVHQKNFRYILIGFEMDSKTLLQPQQYKRRKC